MVKLPPNDDPIWDVVKKHGIPVTVFKVVLRVMLEKKERERRQKAKEAEDKAKH